MPGQMPDMSSMMNMMKGMGMDPSALLGGGGGGNSRRITHQIIHTKAHFEAVFRPVALAVHRIQACTVY